jgi:O-antigen/teichoic acid export membrane protein
MHDRTELTRELSLISKQGSILFLGRFFGIAMKYVQNILFARLLGVSLVGTFYIGFALVQLIGFISQGGLNAGIVKYASQYAAARDHQRLKGTVLSGLKYGAIGGLCGGVLMLLLSNSLAGRFSAMIPSSALRLFSLSVPFLALFMVLMGVIQSSRVMKYVLYIREIGIPLLMSIGLILFVLLRSGRLQGAIFSYILSLGCAVVVCLLLLPRLFPSSMDGRVKAVMETRKLFRVSFPLLAAGVFDQLLIHSSTIILGYFLMESHAGVYGICARISLIFSMTLGSFNTIFSPSVARYYGSRNWDQIRNTYSLVTSWIFIVSSFLFILMIVFARPLLSLFGSEFVNQGFWPLIILSAGQLINAATGPCGTLLQMTNRQRVVLLNQGVIFILHILLNILLVPRFGINGAAAAAAVMLCLNNIVRVLEIYVFWKIQPDMKIFAKFSINAAFVIGTVTLVRGQFPAGIQGGLAGMTLSFILCGILFFAAIYILRAGDSEKLLWNFVKRGCRSLLSATTRA